MHQPASIPPTQPAVAQSPYPLYPNHYSSYPYSNPNPNPYADATSAHTYDAAYYAQSTMYAQVAVDATSADGYYQDPNAQNWANHYASSLATNATAQLMAAQVQPTSFKYAAKNNFLKKRKIPVQHVWCEVCKIECNSKEILDSHKQGKKHKKNLEKLKASLAPASVAPVGVPNNPTIGPQEKPKKRKAKEPEEDLETKKKKIVAGGTKVDLVKTCVVCNVVCNSELVFKYHLAGQKHLTMIKKGKPLSWPSSS